jgi:hypothetical protein
MACYRDSFTFYASLIKHHAMKTYGGEEITHPFLTSALDGAQWSASLPGRFTLRKEALAPIGEDAGWAPEPDWRLWYRENSVDSAGNRSPDVQS